MFNDFKQSLRRIKNVARSRSRTPIPTPVPAPAPAIADPPIQTTVSPTPATSEVMSPAPMPVPPILVSPDPKAIDHAQDPDQALASFTPLAEGRSAKHATWSGLKTLLAVLKDSSDAFGPLKTAVGDFFRCVEIFEQEAKSREEYKGLRSELDVLFSDLSGYLGGSAPPTMTPIIENIANSIEREVETILQKESRSSVGRYAGAAEDADRILECYRRIQTHLGRLTLNANMSVRKSIDEQTMELRLSKLPNAPTAMYRSTVSDSLRRVGCTPNTRVDVLEQLITWARDSTSEKVYWLNGMAGTGKTTIAYTLCDHLQRARQLGASFFCSRQLPECRDVNRIVPSISYQLSLFSLPFRYALFEVLGQHKDIHNQPLQDQFEQLVAVPLRKTTHTFAADVTIVIDALDECEDNEGVGRMLGVLLSYSPDLDVKFFMTSRPEPKILRQMRSREDEGKRSELRLHELDHIVVQQDITTYIKDKLPRDKVSDAQIAELALRSGVLFIYAATVVRYIGYDDFSRSSQRLKVVLGASSTAPNGSDKDVDDLYTTILKAAFNDPALEDSERAEMREMLCHVVCAQEPLSIAAVAGLLKLEEEDIIQAALRPLLSVLNVSEDSGLITTLHESFPNYIFSQKRSGDFYCDARQHHAQMSSLCFDLIKVPNPPFNICNLESSYVFDDDVSDIDERVEEAISEALVYACRYWGAHLELGEITEDLTNAVYELLSVRLLLWMEVLNLQRLMYEGAEILYNVQRWFEAEGCADELRALVQDAYRFVAVVSSSHIVHSTPHIYVSALAFWPKSRPISRCYLPRMSGLVDPTGTAMARHEFTPVTIITHSKVYCVSYSPDGRHIVSGHYDGSIRIWDARTGQSIGRLLMSGHTDYWISSATYTPDGSRIVSVSNDSTVRIWDLHTHEPVGEPLSAHHDKILSVVCSNDNVYMVSFSRDNMSMCIWGSRTGSSLEIETESIQTSAAYSADAAYIVSGSKDGYIHIWNAHTGQTVGQATKGHRQSIECVAYSADGLHIVSGSDDATIRIWDARTGRPIGKSLKGHTDSITSVRYSSSGLRIVSGSYDNTVRIWDARSYQMVGQPFDGHTDTVCSVSYSPDGNHIISGSVDGTIYIWDANAHEMTVKLYRRYDGPIISSSGDESAVLQGTCTCQIAGQSLEGHIGSVQSVSFSPDGVYVVSGSWDTSVCIWDTRTGKMVRQPLRDNSDAVPSVCFSPDGAYIASGSYDQTIRIWDRRTGEAVGQPLRGHASAVRSVSYSPDSAYIVSGSVDRTICIWDAHTGEMVGQPLEGHVDSVYSVSFSPNGAYIVSGSTDRTLRVWDVRTGNMVEQPFIGHTDSVMSVSWSPDGAYIASGSTDKTVRIWDSCTGQMVGQPLTGHTGLVWSVSYSPNGAYIASGSDDKTIRIWDTYTNQMVGHPFNCPGLAVRSTMFSPDGARLASGHDDGSVRIWHIHTRRIMNTWAESPDFRSPTTVPCCCNVCVSPADCDNWELNEDGWVVTERSELLIWVPPDLRLSLAHPHNTTIISRHGTLQLDFSSANLGNNWQSCYSG